MTRSTVEYQFTPVPSQALERLAAAGLSGREFRIIAVIMRKTWGWSKEKDRIPLSQFARLTGIDRRKCHALLISLAAQKIIKRTVAAKGDRKAVTYSFNEIYAEWKLSPSRGTDDKKAQKKKTVPPQGDRLSPSTATKLSPSTAHSIETDINLLTESGEEPPGPFEGVQGPSLSRDNGNPHISLFEPKPIPRAQTPLEREARRKDLQRQAAMLMRAAEESKPEPEPEPVQLSDIDAIGHMGCFHA
jgi:phage replication O-like protein O